MKSLHDCDLVVLSHLRWDFVFQRPQHLLTRFATRNRVFYVEEPCFDTDQAFCEVMVRQNGVRRVVPHLPAGLTEEQVREQLTSLMDQMVQAHKIGKYVLWYYTPMALSFTAHLEPQAVIYDCMDELSLFKGAHPELLKFENLLFATADVVFTGGQSLYESKRDRHPNVHAFPSSIDFEHFHAARLGNLAEPKDQREIPHPRIGFFGVIDERMDLELLAGISRARPDWHFVILGPVVKIDDAALPRSSNIHYLGQKSYSELPAYLAGWDVAMLPFAKNDSTRFISPTKTPEYLAAGKPVVSTSIRDVVRPYGENGMVFIADSVEEFVRATEAALEIERQDRQWRTRVDEFLSQTSWDKTWHGMVEHIEAVIRLRHQDLAQVS